jgi:dGTPase
MQNRFYSDFDTENLEGPRETDYRTPFQADRDRILYTAAFRRLQNKTQVFLAGEFDFYRTRLTHSLEVAQIGRSICHYLQHRGEFLEPDFFIDSDLVEAVCLTHDLGHPPFGHAGERALNRLMRAHGGFEGNAQTLRILTETIYSGRGRVKGMNPSRAFLDGVLKYKSLHRELQNPHNHFVYDEQERFITFAWGGSEGFEQLPAGKQRDRFRSLECQVMDWADDTAYSLNDIVDGFRAGFITVEKVEAWAEGQSLTGSEAAHLQELLRALRDDAIEGRFGRKIGLFIRGCRLGEREANFMSRKSNRYRFELIVEDPVREEADLYSKLAREVVFWSPQLQHLEYKGDFLLRRMFEVLSECFEEHRAGRSISFLPTELSRRLADISEVRPRMRLLCDFLAGMTDSYAVRFYKRLFSPDVGLMSEGAGL